MIICDWNRTESDSEWIGPSRFLRYCVSKEKTGDGYGRSPSAETYIPAISFSLGAGDGRAKVRGEEEGGGETRLLSPPRSSEAMGRASTVLALLLLLVFSLPLAILLLSSLVPGCEEDGCGLTGFGGRWAVVPYRPIDLLPLLPHGVAWPILSSLRSAADLLPSFVGFANHSSSDSRLEWKGACFYQTSAWLEFHNKSGTPFGGGTLHIKVSGPPPSSRGSKNCACSVISGHTSLLLLQLIEYVLLLENEFCNTI